MGGAEGRRGRDSGGGAEGGGTGLAVKPKAQLQGRVWLPVTLAVACYIIYADMNLMEHMCACVVVCVLARVRLSVSAPADILPRLAQLGGMRGPGWLTTKPYHSSARTHNSARTSPVYF